MFFVVKTRAIYIIAIRECVEEMTKNEFDSGFPRVSVGGGIRSKGMQLGSGRDRPEPSLA